MIGSSKLWRLFATLSVLMSTATTASATSDSFFDVWLTAWGGPMQLSSVGPATTYQSVPTEMLSMSLRASAPITVSSDPGTGDFLVDSFFDITYEVTTPGGPTSSESIAGAAVQISFTRTLATASQHDWDTEILSMDLSSGASGGSTTLLGLAPGPGHKHRGHVTVLKSASPGGDSFQVDSFFDVFTELSIDGGTTYNLANTPTSLEHHATVVPEPSTALMLMLGLAGLSRRFAGQRR